MLKYFLHFLFAYKEKIIKVRNTTIHFFFPRVVVKTAWITAKNFDFYIYLARMLHCVVWKNDGKGLVTIETQQAGSLE